MPRAQQRLRIYLIRHPRPAVPPGTCYGQSDVGLDEDAADCAARLRQQLPDGIPLYSSPLRRCRLLAEALHAAPGYDERLREMHFGAWEMRPWSEIPRAELDAWAAAPLAYAPPGGESVAAMRHRVSDFIAERGREGGDFAVVAHAGVMKIFAARLQRLDETGWFSRQFAYGQVTPIDTHPAAMLQANR